MAKKKDSSAAAEAETANATVDALKETLKKVEASLIPAVDSFCTESTTSNGETSLPSSLGLDFLHVKNTLLLSYLIDLLVHLRDTVEPPPSDPAAESDDDEDSQDDESDTEDKTERQQRQQRHRLLEMRTVLDKSRGLDKKLRYQIDKLLSSLTDSSAFATGAEGTNDGSDSGDEDDTGDQQDFANGQDDPLRYRPDPKSMLDDSEDDDDSDEDDDSPDDDSVDDVDEEDEDDDLAAARATLSISKQKKSRKKKHNDDEENDDEDGSDDGVGKKYVAPRLTAVPYTHDVADKQKEQEKRQRRKLRASELAQTLRQQYGDQPDTEDVFGGGNSELYGKQRSASRALAQREAERTEFEESTMVRLTMSRKDKKEKKRVERMMEGGSNLAQIANLGNLVRENEAFGRNDNDDGSDDEYGERDRALQAYMSGEQSGNKSSGGENSSRHANGKRRREPMSENRADGSGRRLKMGKRPKAYNSLQSALYGGGESRSGGKSSKGKKRSKR
jgi:hypothetical protein